MPALHNDVFQLSPKRRLLSILKVRLCFSISMTSPISMSVCQYFVRHGMQSELRATSSKYTTIRGAAIVVGIFSQCADVNIAVEYAVKIYLKPIVLASNELPSVSRCTNSSFQIQPELSHLIVGRNQDS
jgi:hypothetical protein